MIERNKTTGSAHSSMSIRVSDAAEAEDRLEIFME
jgi:hypothetical protein